MNQPGLINTKITATNDSMDDIERGFVPDLLAAPNDICEATDPSSEESKPSQGSTIKNRLLFAFCLWALDVVSTWRVSSWIWNRALGPNKDFLEKQLNRLDNMTSEIDASFEQCHHDKGAICREATLDAASHANETFATLFTLNEAKINGNRQWQIDCAKTESMMEVALHELVLSGEDLPFQPSCPVDQREIILAKAGGDLQAGRDEAASAVDTFFDVATGEATKTADFVQRRIDYDWRYITKKVVGDLEIDLQRFDAIKLDIDIELANKLQPQIIAAFNRLQACVQPRPGNPVKCPQVPILIALNEVVALAISKMSFAKDQVNFSTETIQRLLSGYEDIAQTLATVLRVLNEVRKVLGKPFELILERLGVDLDALDLIPSSPLAFVDPRLVLRALPASFLDLPDLQPLFEGLADITDAVTDEVGEALVEATDAIKSKASDAKEEVLDHLEEVFNDYDPPQYDGADTGSIEDAIKKSFREKVQPLYENVRAVLAGFRAAVIGVSSEPNVTVTSPQRVNFTTVAADVQETTLNLLPVSIPGWTLLKYMAMIASVWIIPNLLYIQFGLRIWGLGGFYKKFYDESVIPPFEVQVGAIEHAETVNRDKEEKTWYQRVLTSILFHQYLFTFARILLRFVVLLCIAGVYWVYLGHYRANCVKAKTGTALTRNVIEPIFVNKISLDGYKAFTNETRAWFILHNRECGKVNGYGTYHHRLQEDRSNAVVNQHFQTMEQIEEPLACVDFGSIDLGLQTQLQSCAQPFNSTLERGVTDCSEWPQCEIECDRDTVTKEVERITIEATCLVEWAVHSHIWTLVFIVFQVFLLGFAAKLFVGAFRDLWWKKFRSPTVGVRYMHNVETGQPEIVGDFATSRQASIDARLRWTKCTGWLKLVGGIFILVSWWALRIYLAATRYDPFEPEWYEG